MIGNHRSYCNPFSKEEHSGNLSTPSIDKGKKNPALDYMILFLLS